MSKYGVFSGPYSPAFGLNTDIYSVNLSIQSEYRTYGPEKTLFTQCICHDLLIAKLNAYGFDRNALKLIYDYLSDRSQKTKVDSSFSAYLDIICGVPQGSILGPLLFNLDLCDLFLEDYSSDFANFADDTTLYECGPTLNEVMNNLETTTEKMFKWLSFNNLKANASKCHFFLSPYQPVPVNIKGSIIESSNCEKLLGIYIDSNFSFEYYINRICRKSSQKLHALSRSAKYISEDKKKYAIQIFLNCTIQLLSNSLEVP